MNLKKISIALTISSLLLLSACFSEEATDKDIEFIDNNDPKIFIFVGGLSHSKEYTELERYKKLLSNPEISGAQVIYRWKSLEPKQGVYDFSAIKQDIAFLKKLGKKLFIQLQDRSFSKEVINTPKYLEQYDGGSSPQVDFPGEGKPLAMGWVANQWNIDVRKSFQQLILALGKEFDGKIYGINLPETSADVDLKNPPANFTCKKYFDSIIENMGVLKQAFSQSKAVQYINFLPCEWNNDQGYMEKVFETALKHDMGVGGPDVAPYRRGHMKNSYPFLNKNKDKLFISMAVQSPDYTYKNPTTGKHFTMQELHDFAYNYLGAKTIFWTIQEPQFSQKVLPFLKKKRIADQQAQTQ